MTTCLAWAATVAPLALTGLAPHARHAPQFPEGQAEGLSGETTSLFASPLVLLPPALRPSVGLQCSTAPVAVPVSGLASAGTETAGHDSQRLDTLSPARSNIRVRRGRGVILSLRHAEGSPGELIELISCLP